MLAVLIALFVPWSPSPVGLGALPVSLAAEPPASPQVLLGFDSETRRASRHPRSGVPAATTSERSAMPRARPGYGRDQRGISNGI